MGSALSPREIQSRIRAGESLEEVATDAGVPASSIASFAGPVLAERSYIAKMARTATVRRKDESTSNRRLGDVIADSLRKLGTDPDSALWDAWRGSNRMWTVMVTYHQDEETKEASFHFDQRGRFSTPSNATARDLIGDYTAPKPVLRPTIPDTDSEPTLDLNDELALVRVVQESTDLLEITDYQDAELEQVDGIYNIVRNSRSEMDVLYEMLASFNEDSVNIYAGLLKNRRDDTDSEPIEEEVVQEEQSAEIDTSYDEGSPSETTTTNESEIASHPAATVKQVDSTEQVPIPPSSVPSERTDDDAANAVEESQDFLPELTKVPTDIAADKPKPKRAPKKRASIPSWDEIMFGSPRPE